MLKWLRSRRGKTIRLGLLRGAIATVALVTLSILIDPLPHPVNWECDPEAFLANKSDTVQIHALKVVMEPWLGEHHVYGIFVVPEWFITKPQIVLNVEAVGSFCGTGYIPNRHIDGIPAPQGTFLLKHFVRTRAALLAILKGKRSQISQPDSWSLIYSERDMR